jgi:hypothetical protein
MSAERLFDHDDRDSEVDERAAIDPSGIDQEVTLKRVDRDPRNRPYDPAGTRPKFDPQDLLPPRALPFRVSSPLSGDEPSTSLPRLAVGPPAAETRSHIAKAQFLLGALIALGLIAIVGIVVATTRPAAKPAPPWSAWQPHKGDVDPAIQIAEHVEPEYRNSNGLPLVQVTGSPLTIGGVPGVLALYGSSGNLQAFQNNVVVYQLCGTGVSCSITGTASTNRFLLLSREAMELAMYTFRYVSNAGAVVVIIPPPPPGTPGGPPANGSSSATSTSPLSSGSSSPTSTGTNTGIEQRALLFRPADLSKELGQPLARTLGTHTPSIATVTSDHQTPLTTLNTFSRQQLYSYFVDTSNQSVGPVLVLSPPGVGG